MTDPVIGSDGQTYERSAITQWLRTNRNSPLTRQPMTLESLKPNYALKSAIDRFRSRPRPKTAPRHYQPPQVQQVVYPSAPPTLPTPMPSAPPADDVYYAIQVYHHELAQQQQQQQQPLLRNAVVQESNRRRQMFIGFVCAALIIVLIILVSRIYAASAE